MKIPRFFTLILFVIVVHIFAAGELLACSCGRLPNVAESYRYSDGVFIGKVKEVQKTSQYGPVRVNLLIEMAWRGIFQPDTFIWTNSGGGDCGYNFAIGETYLIFAWHHSDGSLWTDICARTAPLSQSWSDPIYISSLSLSNFDRGGRIYGKLSPSAAGIPVILQDSTGQRQINVTNSIGNYDFVDLKAGTYRVYLDSQPWFSAEEMVTLHDSHHHARRDIYTKDLGRFPPLDLPEAGSSKSK